MMSKMITLFLFITTLNAFAHDSKWVAGASIGQVTFRNNEKNDGHNFALEAGRVFSLSSSLKLTTSLRLTRIENYTGFIEGKTNYHDVGLAPRLSYDIETTNFLLSPYVRGSFSYGRVSYSYAEFDDDYRKYGGGLGIAFETDSKLVPSIEYSMERIVFNGFDGNFTQTYAGLNIWLNYLF